MNDLTKAAKEGIGKSKEQRLKEVDKAMKDYFCPLIDGDCRGIRCMLYDEDNSFFCGVSNFFWTFETQINDIKNELMKMNKKGI